MDGRFNTMLARIYSYDALNKKSAGQRRSFFCTVSLRSLLRDTTVPRQLSWLPAGVSTARPTHVAENRTRRRLRPPEKATGAFLEGSIDDEVDENAADYVGQSYSTSSSCMRPSLPNKPDDIPVV